MANVMTNAWWWWIVFGDVAPTAESAFDKIDRTMRRLVETVAAESAASGRSLRECALALAARNGRALAERVGIAPKDI
jgi:glutamate dehydrogenase (NAD(P)+)